MLLKNLILQINFISYSFCPQNKRKEILKKLSKFPIEVKVLPSVDNIVNGEVTIDSIKHVQVEDILGRTPVSPQESLLKKNIKGKNILVTGLRKYRFRVI